MRSSNCQKWNKAAFTSIYGTFRVNSVFGTSGSTITTSRGLWEYIASTRDNSWYTLIKGRSRIANGDQNSKTWKEDATGMYTKVTIANDNEGDKR